MLDLGWSELVVVAILTVLIFGPKELPTVLRTVTQFVSKARGMARDFQRTMDDVARQAELDKLKDEVTDIANPNNIMDPTGSENNMFDKLFDDDEEDDGTPVKRKSTSPVPGFDSAPEEPESDTATTAEANPDAEPGADPEGTAAAVPVETAEAESPTADDKKAGNA